MNFQLFPATVAILALAACETVPPIPQSPAAKCPAPQLQNIVGNHIGATDFTPQPADMRIIGPDQAITMDYSPSRLNIDVDKSGIITRVWCG